MVKPFFSKKDAALIVGAIREAEAKSRGQIHVHVRARCHKDPLTEAKLIFKKLGLHKTPEKNAVLIFIAPESRRFAILGDEGIHSKTGSHFWDKTKDQMLAHFKENKIKEGVLAGIRGAGTVLQDHFPPNPVKINVLPDAVTED